MAKKHERTFARRMAVQALYQSEITGEGIGHVASEQTVLPDNGALPAYSVELLCAVQEHLDEIDARISEASKNWALSRMPIVDRAILRCAICEMLFIDDVPVKVCINEAVELAKEFGGEDESASFVNGILGRIARSGDSGGTGGATGSGHWPKPTPCAGSPRPRSPESPEGISAAAGEEPGSGHWPKPEEE